jgi:hypothetical protein
MDVALHRLAPGVQHGGDAERSVPMTSGKGLQGVRCAGEQQVVNQFFVPAHPVVDRMRQREDGMKIGYRQQFVFARFDPARFLQPLTFRAVAVATGVVAVVKGAAVSAVVDVPAQCRGAAVLDATEYLVHVQRIGGSARAGSRANARAGCRQLRTSVSGWSRSACVPLYDWELERKGMAMPLSVLILFLYLLFYCLFQRRSCFVSGVVSSNAIAF